MYTSGWERCWCKPSPGTKSSELERQRHGKPRKWAANERRGVTRWLQTAQSLGGVGWREAPRGQCGGCLAPSPSSNQCNQTGEDNPWGICDSHTVQILVTEWQRVLDCCSPKPAQSSTASPWAHTMLTDAWVLPSPSLRWISKGAQRPTCMKRRLNSVFLNHSWPKGRPRTAGVKLMASSRCFL